MSWRADREQIRVIHYPVLSRPDFGFVRGPGPGLGNLLFPIGRAVIALKPDDIIVTPTLRQFKVGPWLRGERDARTYGNVTSGRTGREWVEWFGAKALDAGIVDSLRVGQFRYKLKAYSGVGRQFHDLEGGSKAILNFLMSRCISPPDRSPEIGVHIRQGDFIDPPPGVHGQSYRVPLYWYRKAVDAAKIKSRDCGRRVTIFTDGDHESITEYFQGIDFEFDQSPNALSSILRLSKSKVIVGSRSTFSLWASFLSDGLSVWPSNFDVNNFKAIQEGRDMFV